MKNTSKCFDYEYGDLDDFGIPQHRRFEPSLPTNLDAHITLNPHYSNPLFANKGEVEIWGRKTPETVDYVYSDRLRQWNYEAAKRAAEAVKASGVNHSSARWVQEFLSAYYDRPVEVTHIYSGVFPHSGYSYWVAGYKWAKQVEG